MGTSATGHEGVFPCEGMMNESPRNTVRILDEDRTFGAVLSKDDLSAARRYAIADVHELSRGVAIHCVQRVDVKLLLLFWHLADRFGTVTPAGTVVPLSLSHADLAELVGAARPSVSTALKCLAEQGFVQRNRADRSWLLASQLPEQLQDIRRNGVRGAG